MPFYEVITSETVRGVYHVNASDPDEVRAKWEKGEIFKPHVYEATDAEIVDIKQCKE